MDYRTLKKDGSSFLEEKRSKFLGDAFHVENVSEAEDRLLSVAKKYHDARHHCYAWIVGKDSEFVKYADDGEPQGTAGQPILELLKTAGLTDSIVIVTRYFGGILLGTGGLSRAYREAARKAIEDAGVLRKYEAEEIRADIDYALYGKIENLFRTEELPKPEARFAGLVGITLRIPSERTEEILRKITDLSQGRFSMTERKKVFLVGEENG